MFARVVGDTIQYYKDMPDGVTFDMNNEGASLTYHMNSPSDNEVKSLANGLSQFALAYLNGVIIILSKFGNLNWCDSPYDSNLSKYLTLPPEEIFQNSRMVCVVSLIDTKDGRVLSLRAITFSIGFTKKMFALACEQRSNPFNTDNYHQKLSAVYSMYSTEKMLHYSLERCKGGE